MYFLLNRHQTVKMTGKKFCFFLVFGGFATHLVYLGELAQIKYTAVRNKSMHYTQFVEDYLHNNKSQVFRERTKILMLPHKEQSLVTKVLLITSNPRSGSSFTGEEIEDCYPFLLHYFSRGNADGLA